MKKLNNIGRALINVYAKLPKVITNNCSECDSSSYVMPYSDIPGPKPLPILGNTWRFLPIIGDIQIEHVDKLSRKLYEKYGKIVKMEGLMGRPDMLFLFDPEQIEKVFRMEDNLPYRPSMPSLNYYKHVYKKEFFGDNAGIIAVHGKEWQNFRSKVNQIMLQPRIAKMYVNTISLTSQEFIARIKQIMDENKEVPENFLYELHKWSLECLAKIALDVRLGSLEEYPSSDTKRLIDAIHTFFINVPILELKIPFWRIWNTPTFKAYIKALDTIREIIMKYVNIGFDNLKNDDYDNLSVLQRVLKINNNPKIAENLALDLFLVGIDTTSNAAGSIIYQLALHQDKQRILREEIMKLLPNKNDPINNDKLNEMYYLKACIKETMRMFPVVIGNGRVTTNDCVIDGYFVPKGVHIIFQHCVISNLNKYFIKSKEFIPERWLKNHFLHGNVHPFVSLPFGFGKRMCLGKRFADLELQILLVHIIRNFRIEYHHEKLSYHIHPMYTPNGPLKLKFIEN